MAKSPLSRKEVAELEEAAQRPRWLPPTLFEKQSAGARWWISVPSLYWGTHRMLHALFADRDQASRAERLVAELTEAGRL